MKSASNGDRRPDTNGPAKTWGWQASGAVPPRKQGGFLMEVPLIMMATGFLLAILVPALPSPFNRILVAAGALVWTWGLYHLLVIPGWQPGSPPLRRWARVVVFFLVAGALLTGAGVYVFGGLQSQW